MKIARWREKYDQIPEDTKDPGLLKAKKSLKKKMPTRRSNEQYWNEAQFHKLCAAPPGKLYSRGPLALAAAGLHARRLARSRPDPPAGGQAADGPRPHRGRPEGTRSDADDALAGGLRDAGAAAARRPRSWPRSKRPPRPKRPKPPSGSISPSVSPKRSRSWREADRPYKPLFARPTENLAKLLLFRGIHPLYAVFLVNQLGIADRNERIQAMESVLELPGSVAHFVRVPRQDELPPGPLATLRLDPHLLQLGLATPEELSPMRPTTRRDDGHAPPFRRRGAEMGADAGRQAPPAVRLRFSPASTTCGPRRSGRRASCCSSAATSTSTSPARPCKSRRGCSSATCCG